MKNNKFSIKSLGCKVNQYEEQAIRENLLKRGFVETDPLEADFFIVNSCTVTDQADKKTIRLIKKIKKENPVIKVIFTGCYAVLDKDISKLESIPEIHEVVPAKRKMDIPLILESLFSEPGVGDECVEEVSGFDSHTRAFLKVQDGCDQSCSYCKVTIVRGPSVSRDEEDILREVIRLADKGYKEIVLTGICIGSWKGNDNRSFSDLVENISRIDKEFRVRISSIEPNHIDEKLIELLSSSRKICRHLHIPLQSGSDTVLKNMNRRYDTVQYEGIINSIRDKVPGIGITLDVISGFPGETDNDFKDTVNFIKKIRPSRLHVFRYSDREGTRSFEMDGKISKKRAKDRVANLIKVGESLQKDFAISFIGRKIDVLVEEKGENGLLYGYTSEYVRARLPEGKAKKSDIVTAFPSHIDEDDICLICDM